MEIQEIDRKELECAKELLENPGIAAKITNAIGMPIEKGFKMLPDNWNANIGDITKTALLKATEAALFTMKDTPCEKSSNIWHTIAVATTGGIAGFFGLPAISIELPISTTIMLRSIADIARSQKEEVFTNEAKLECINVFALGGPSSSDDASESGYFVVRTALAHSVTEALEYIGKRGIIEEGAPALIRFIVQVSERFSIQVTEKIAAQAIPAIGAVGGSLINTLFINHFQDMARGHFTVRRLERKYGKEMIEMTYKKI